MNLARVKVAGIGTAVLALGIAIGLLAWSPINPHATATSGDTMGFPTIFRDTDGQLVLAVRLGADQGTFDFSVKGVGHYQGRVPVSQSGPDVIHLQGDVAGSFSATGEVPWTQASLSFEGIVKPASGDANVNIWAAGTKYHLKSSNGSDSDATNVLQQLLQAFQAKDWATVYLLENVDVTSTVTEAQFAQNLAAQSPGSILAMTPSGASYRTSAMGFQYFVQPVTVQWQKPDGSTTTFPSRVHLVLEQGTWRFLGTDPAPAP
jgi:hypothetical protein